jgi:putative ABC transport system substrate-binding protein
MIGRREFIALLGCATAWPVGALGQQATSVRRIGVFQPGAADASEYEARNAAFLQGLGQLGWIVGRNARIEFRWGAGHVERYPAMAQELVALAPDIILGNGSAIVTALQRASRTVPIVFANISDPVGSGLIESLARPGGNTTGFISQEFGFAGKWLELLREIAPRVTRVAVLRDSAIASQIGILGGIQSVAPGLGVEMRPIDLRDSDEIERAVAALAYDADRIEIYRRTASYVDRVLRGERVGRSAISAADQLSAYDQPQDCQGARPRCATDAPRPRRRGDRIRRRCRSRRARSSCPCR